MGCTESKEEQRPPTRKGSALQRDPSTVNCPHCSHAVAREGLNAHTTNCEEREVTCWHSWCREVIRRRELDAHMTSCAKRQRTHCPKCGESVLALDMQQHRESCNVVSCSHCPEQVIPRILRYCPAQVFGRLGQLNVGPYASTALRERFLSVRPGAAAANAPVPSGSTRTRAVVDYNVARVQHLWRWAKARALVDDLLYRIVYREIDLKKETFPIFKAHDRLLLDEGEDNPAVRARRERQKSAAPVMALPATAGHFFPISSQEPITVGVVEKVIGDFTKDLPLPYYAVWRIFNDAHTALKKMPNITRVGAPLGAQMDNGRWSVGGKIVVVGDLHGQLADLLHILHENGLPSSSCVYIFNGDFVDRGERGVEILLILCLLLICFPLHVALNRGNHECDYMNEEYGFDVEVQTKYDRNIYKQIQRCFCALPLATLVGGRILVVHGGLPRRKGVMLEDVERIQRFRQIPMPEHQQPDEDEMFQDLMWSDPWESPGWVESDRGVGAQFGPDITEAFLRTNKLDRVIRSHEEFVKGHEHHHGGKVITVFSASNYDGPESNFGAYVQLVGESSEVSFHTYRVDEDEFLFQGEIPETPGMGARVHSMGGTFTNLAGIHHTQSFSQYANTLMGSVNPVALMQPGQSHLLQPFYKVRRTKDDVMRKLRDAIYDRRHQILSYFSKMDRTQKGSVWKMEWVETMRNVLNLDIPWFFLRETLAEPEPRTFRINYTRFLARFRHGLSDMWLPAWEHDTMVRLYMQMVGGRRKSPALQQLVDKEVLGYIDFCNIMRGVDYQTTDAELFQLFLALDVERRGFLSGPLLIRRLELAMRDQESATTAAISPRMDAATPIRHADPALAPPPLSDGLPPAVLACAATSSVATSSLAIGAGAGPLSDVSWDLEQMEQLQRIVAQLGASLHQLFRVPLTEKAKAVSFETFSTGLAKLCKGPRRPIVLSEAQHRLIYDFLLQHAGDESEGVTIESFFMSCMVRDRVLLAQRRERFQDAARRLLGDGAVPMQRILQSFRVFGPTESPFPATPVGGHVGQKKGSFTVPGATIASSQGSTPANAASPPHS